MEQLEKKRGLSATQSNKIPVSTGPNAKKEPENGNLYPEGRGNLTPQEFDTLKKLRSDMVALEKLRKQKWEEEGKDRPGDKGSKGEIRRKRRLYEKEGGLGKKSIFWDPLLNPFGVAPKGYKNVEWDSVRQKNNEQKTGNDNGKQEDGSLVDNTNIPDWIQNIPLPSGKIPGVDLASDEEREYERERAEQEVQITEYSSAPQLRDFVKEVTSKLVPAAVLRNKLLNKRPVKKTGAVQLANAQLKNKAVEQDGENQIGPQPPAASEVLPIGPGPIGPVGPVGPVGPGPQPGADDGYEYDDAYYSDGYDDNDYDEAEAEAYDEENADELEESGKSGKSEKSEKSNKPRHAPANSSNSVIGPNPPGPKQPTLEDYQDNDYSEEYADVSSAYAQVKRRGNQEDENDEDGDEYDEFGNYIGDRNGQQDDDDVDMDDDDQYNKTSGLAPEEEEYLHKASNSNKRKHNDYTEEEEEYEI